MDILSEVKLVLRIESDDNDSDDLLEHHISTGKAYLNGLAGGELDYTNLENKTLLLNYIRYAFNDAHELFIDNFQDDILRMQFEHGIKVMQSAAIKKQRR